MSKKAELKRLDVQIGRVMETVQALDDWLRARRGRSESHEAREQGWMELVACEAHLGRWIAMCSDQELIADMRLLFGGSDEDEEEAE